MTIAIDTTVGLSAAQLGALRAAHVTGVSRALPCDRRYPR